MHSRDSSGVDLSGKALLLAVLLLHLTGPSVFVLQPVVVQGFVQQLQFSPTQANFAMFIEGAGKAAASIALMWLVSRVSWRILLRSACAIMVIGNVASMFVHSYEPLLVIRASTGAAAGIIVPLCYATVGLTPRSDRNFGILWAVLLAYAALVFLVAPRMYAEAGMNALFGLFASLGAAGLILTRWMPCSGVVDADASATAEKLVTLQSVAGIAVIFLFSTAAFMFWANAALIGQTLGLSDLVIGEALALSQILGIAGALTTAAIAMRWGRRVPLMGLMFALGVSVALALGEPRYLGFAVAVGLFNYAWNAADPYLLGTLASLDRSGRIVVYGTAMRMIGVAAGPAIAAWLLNVADYAAVLHTSVALFAVCLLLVLPLTKRSGI